MKEKLIVMNKNLSVENSNETLGEFYDKNAPAFYGHIIELVKHKDIADRVLVKTFVDVFNNNIPTQKYLSPFTSILNHSRKKSNRTLKAIKLFQAFNSGHTVTDSSNHTTSL